MITVEDFIYKGKVKIISTPKRELSIESEYPNLVGLKVELPEFLEIKLVCLLITNIINIAILAAIGLNRNVC